MDDERFAEMTSKVNGIYGLIRGVTDLRLFAKDARERSLGYFHHERRNLMKLSQMAALLAKCQEFLKEKERNEDV